MGICTAGSPRVLWVWEWWGCLGRYGPQWVKDRNDPYKITKYAETLILLDKTIQIKLESNRMVAIF